MLNPSHTVVQIGYRHIDCAKAYKNEKEVIVPTFKCTEVFFRAWSRRERFYVFALLLVDWMSIGGRLTFVTTSSVMQIGDALQELYKEGIVKREDLFITSKLWLGIFYSIISQEL